MRIISLNTWGGRAGKEKLLDFFKKYAPLTDAFCLQEIWSGVHHGFDGRNAGGTLLDYSTLMKEGVAEITEALSDFTPLFSPLIEENYGLFILLNKKYPVTSTGERFVYKEKGFVADWDMGDHARSIQWVTTQRNNAPFSLFNFHGLWNGKGKTDTDERIQQSKNILAFLEKQEGEYVVCGDFNLLPDSESIRLFEEAGLRNLIREHSITSTRTSFYKKPGKYADYAFLTPGLRVKDFRVLPDEVSDHAALFLEVE